MQEKSGKIFGIPYVVVLFVVVATVPSLIATGVTYNKTKDNIDGLRQEVKSIKVLPTSVVVTPTIAPTATPTAALKRVLPVTKISPTIIK